MDPRIALALRRRRPHPVRPEDLSRELGVPPREMAAAVDALGRRGFVVESHPMEGLRLVETPPALVAEEIACGLAVSRIGRRVRCVATAASTNDLAWKAADRQGDAADGLAIFAEYQTAGRGRRGNRWTAPPHTSILCSVIVRVPLTPTRGGLLTRAAAVAVAEAIEAELGLSVGIRWPNDLVVDDLKVGGILVEARPVAGGTGPAVIGIGVNCTQTPEVFPPDIRPGAAGLAMFAEAVDRTLLARRLLERLDQAVGRVDDDRVDELRRLALERCRTLGRRITVTDGDGRFSGEVLDLDPDYELVLRSAEGGIRRFAAMTTHIVSQDGV